MNDEYIDLLWEAYAASHTQDHRNRLVEAYLPLAGKIARRFLGRGLDLEDLIQTASLSLIKAVESFDPSRGVRFSSYAVPSIAGAIRNELRDRAAPIRLPEGQMEKKRLILKTMAEYEKTHSRSPTSQEIADLLHMDAADVLLLTSRRFLSLDAFTSETEESTFESLLGTTDEEFTHLENKEWLAVFLREAGEQEKSLFHLRYEQSLGQRETAKIMGISQMQVSRLERRMIAKLREDLAGKTNTMKRG